MTRLRREFDIPIPLRDVQEQWRRVQARRRAEVRFAPLDESHTRVEVSAQERLPDVRLETSYGAAGLAGTQAAGNPAARGVAPGGAGGTFPGGTGGTPGPGGGKPGTTP